MAAYLLAAVTPAGSAEQRGIVNRDPRWSPDGTRIAFSRRGAAGDDLYVMNADGTGVVRLTGQRDRATRRGARRSGR